MSYQKAADLLQLALEISAHRFGMAYSIIDERSDAPTSNGKSDETPSGCSRRSNGSSGRA